MEWKERAGSLDSQDLVSFEKKHSESNIPLERRMGKATGASKFGVARLGSKRGLPWVLAVIACSISTVATAQEAVETEETEPVTDPEPVDPARVDRLERLAAEQSDIIEQQRVRMDELAKRSAAAEARAAEAEQLADLATEMNGGEVEQEDDRLRIYGFTDVALSKIYVGEDSRFAGLVDRNSSFALGNLNVYFDANPHPSIRALSEVRFSLFPHGNLTNDFDRVDASTYDVTSATGRNRVIQGSIILERAWIEWKEFDAFKVRAGYFLTPYGIWNIDHGAPVLISVVLPTFWASEYFPTHQMGAMALGEVFYKRLEFGYRAYVSNGRVSGQLDGDFFKNLGGRVYVRRTGDIDTQVGLSGFWGKEATYDKQIVSFEPFLVESTKATEYEEFGVAADVSVDVGDLRVRSEFVLNQREFSEGLREPAAPPGTFQRDETRWNVYGIASYRTPLEWLEPFVFLEHARRPTLSDNGNDVFSAGLMTHLAPGTKFTFQAYYVHFPSDDEFPDASDNDFPGWSMRLSTAF